MSEKLTAEHEPQFEVDAHGNRIGVPVKNDQTPLVPRGALIGTYARLEPLDVDKHASDLFTAYVGADHLWTYMPHGPFLAESEFGAWVESKQGEKDPYFYAIVDQQSGKAFGVASYLRIDPGARSIEVGWITYSPLLQRSRIATEAMFLMMRNAFDLGYRRYEWKCDVLNTSSMRAAQRLGMTYEGTFRQATVVKGHNRDTAWFAILDTEWPIMQRAFEQWLDSANFDARGNQMVSLDFFRASNPG
jgi:RimJ/RimL family protein N-acetyltransferase